MKTKPKNNIKPTLFISQHHIKTALRVLMGGALLLLILLLAASCNRKEKALEAALADLQQQTQEREAELTSAYEDLHEIEAELALVSETHADGSIMIPLAQESDWDPANRIMDEIRYLNTLIQNKSDKINEMEAALAQSKSQLAGVRKDRKQVQEQVAALEAELESAREEIKSARHELVARTDALEELRSQLTNRIAEIDALEMLIIDKDIENLELTQELDQKYTGYYIHGDFKSLKEAGVVKRKGGVAGVGGIKQLEEDFDPEQFASIDIRNTPKIPVQAKKVELVTAHPENSYSLVEEEGEITAIEITDPENFWKAGQVLVMVTK